jgi:hypothetical protein
MIVEKIIASLNILEKLRWGDFIFYFKIDENGLIKHTHSIYLIQIATD